MQVDILFFSLINDAFDMIQFMFTLLFAFTWYIFLQQMHKYED